MKTNTILTIAGVGLGVLLLTSTKKDGENITFTLGGGGYSTGVGASSEETPTIYNVTNEYNIPAADLSGLFDFNNEITKKSSSNINKKSNFASNLYDTTNLSNEDITKIKKSYTSFNKKSNAQMSYADEVPTSPLNNILNGGQ